jgi:geranylgeranyl reductase family protein
MLAGLMWDVLVVGGGPAGSAAALRALQLRPGARVLLLDAARFPRDKACGDGIPAHALDVLTGLGVADAVAGYPPVPRMRLRTPGGVCVLGVPPRPNYVVPRLVFDARLIAAAESRGAVIRRSRVRRLEVRPDAVVVDGEHTARVVIGADGANSAIRRLLGLPANPPGHLAIAVRGYAAAPPAAGPPEQLIHMVDEGWPAYAWSFPTGTGVVNVGFGKLRSRLGGAGRGHRAELYGPLAALLPELPADPVTLRAHHLPLSTWRPRQPDGRVLLAGDAASLINPLTGEGIFYAVLSGRLAADAALAGGGAGARYRAALRARLGRHLRHTGALARITRRRTFVDAALAVAAGRPATFDALVEVGLGAGVLSVPDLGRVAFTWCRTGWSRRLDRPA